MSRFLFVVPPLTGHVNPTVAVAAELARRGHAVAWAGDQRGLPPLLPAGARVFPAGDDALDERLKAARLRWLDLRGPAAMKFLWEEFLVPLGHAMVPGVRAAVAAFGPDVLVADQQAFAGPVVARLTGTTWVTSATTTAEIGRPLAAMPKVEAWVQGKMSGFADAYGAPDLPDLRFADRLVLVFSTPDLAPSGAPPACVFTGPALAGRPEGGDFPWEWLDPDRDCVLASLGTLNGPAGTAFFRAAVEAVADAGATVQLVIVAPPDEVGPVPPHVLVRPHVPQLALLPRLRAVVSHAGHNTVCESLAHGLPLVVAPIRDDQPIVAEQVVAAGAAVRVSFRRIRVADLRAALLAVLTDPGYRAAAHRVARSFAAAGGASAAADHLEKVL